LWCLIFWLYTNVSEEHSVFFRIEVRRGWEVHGLYSFRKRIMIGRLASQRQDGAEIGPTGEHRTA
jgi:hypothetical protein